MRRAAMVVGVIWQVAACHDVTQRERAGKAGDGAAGDVAGGDGAADVAPRDGGGGQEDGSHAGKPTVIPRGESGAWSEGGAAGEPQFPESAPAAAGSGGAAPECTPGAPCTVAGACWVGTTVCSGEEGVCAPRAPRPARTPCGIDGECSGDGACVKRVPSCAQVDERGCGVVTIAGGSFRLGWQRHAVDGYAGDPVTLESFAIDAYEVTVARFRHFWAALPALVRTVRYPDGLELTVDAAPLEPDVTDLHRSYNWTPEPGSREDHPINRLNWETAFLFCAWDGGRLPTEAEWEYVATGRSVDGLEPGRTYPWGEQPPDCTLTNSLDCGVGTTVPVDRFAAWGGVHQMAGNVTEWTADAWSDLPGDCWDGSPRTNPLCRIASGYNPAKGGSFASAFDQGMGAGRLKSTNGVSPRGVRCARDLLPGTLVRVLGSATK